MKENIAYVLREMEREGLSFIKPPLIIGGQAMEYYGIRKAGHDIDLVISDEDYFALAERYSDKRKDLYGDLGVLPGIFEIWRSIALLDYKFFDVDSIDEGSVKVISLDRLLWTRVCAMDVEKYRRDLELMREFYYKEFRNREYLTEAGKHLKSYEKFTYGVLNGGYED